MQQAGAASLREAKQFSPSAVGTCLTVPSARAEAVQLMGSKSGYAAGNDSSHCTDCLMRNMSIRSASMASGGNVSTDCVGKGFYTQVPSGAFSQLSSHATGEVPRGAQRTYDLIGGVDRLPCAPRAGDFRYHSLQPTFQIPWRLLARTTKPLFADAAGK